MSSSGLKKVCARFYHPPNILLRSPKYSVLKRMCSNTLKRNELKVYISLKENKLACFTNCIDKARFKYMIWFMISEKSITRCTFPHCGGARMHQKSQTRHKKIVYQNLQFFQPLRITFMWTLVFIDLNTYILTEDRNFKTFLKENYAIALDSCYTYLL